MIWNDSESPTSTVQQTWLDVAQTLDIPIGAADVDETLDATGGDVTATARRLFPGLPVEALQELLWAIGERERRTCLLPC